MPCARVIKTQRSITRSDGKRRYASRPLTPHAIKRWPHVEAASRVAPCARLCRDLGSELPDALPMGSPPEIPGRRLVRWSVNIGGWLAPRCPAR